MTRPTSRGTWLVHRAAAGALLSILVVALVGASAPTAWAHVAGRAQVLLSDVRFTPRANGWVIKVDCVDLDSGAPVLGGQLRMVMESGTGVGPVEVPLVLGDAPGIYTGSLTAHPGLWLVTVHVRSRPGWPAIYPYDHAFTVNLVAGQAVRMTHGAPAQHAGGWLGIGGDGLAAGTVSSALLLAWLRSRRRRTATQGTSEESLVNA